MFQIVSSQRGFEQGAAQAVERRAAIVRRTPRWWESGVLNALQSRRNVRVDLFRPVLKWPGLIPGPYCRQTSAGVRQFVFFFLPLFFHQVGTADMNSFFDSFVIGDLVGEEGVRFLQFADFCSDG